MRKLKTALAVLVLLTAAVAILLKLYTDYRVHQAEIRYPPRGQFAFVEGLQLHYVSNGTGRPVVLIHGDGGSTYDWTMSIFNRIARKYQAIAFALVSSTRTNGHHRRTIYCSFQCLVMYLQAEHPSR